MAFWLCDAREGQDSDWIQRFDPRFWTIDFPRPMMASAVVIAPDALRICLTEAAIDAISLAALEGLREGSLYLSTGGGWSPATEAAVRSLASRSGAQLLAATDANAQGETFAGRLRDIAEEASCEWFRLTPPAEDWNDALRKGDREN